MGEFVQLTAADGHRLQAYKAVPGGTAEGAIVVIQEIFGVNSHIRSVCDGFAGDGYLAIAPALFDRTERDIELGYAADDIARGRALKGEVGYDDALLDTAAAIAALGDRHRVGIVGYCWGGSVAYLAACRLDGLSAAVGYYGGQIADFAAETPKVPTMLHFGRSDASIPMAAVEKVRAAQPGVECHLYDAGHGFNCDQRGSYDETSAAVARERTLSHFLKHLRG